jgi:hypothetical protein
MYKTRISSGWKFFLIGGCAAVALCGAAFLALLIFSAWTTQPTPSVQSVSPQETDSGVSVSDALTGHRWRMQSSYLGDGIILEADFKEGGGFDGIITAPPNPYETPTYQQVSGKWKVAGSRLFLDWEWTWNGYPDHWHIPIEISSVSQYNLQGVYEGELSLSLWEFERID